MFKFKMIEVLIDVLMIETFSFFNDDIDENKWIYNSSFLFTSLTIFLIISFYVNIVSVDCNSMYAHFFFFMFEFSIW